MENGDAATHALAEAFGMVVEEAASRAVSPLQKEIQEIREDVKSIHQRLGSVESEVHGIHDLVQVPEAQERLRLIGQGLNTEAGA